jgi:predicted membrane protein
MEKDFFVTEVFLTLVVLLMLRVPCCFDGIFVFHFLILFCVCVRSLKSRFSLVISCCSLAELVCN